MPGRAAFAEIAQESGVEQFGDGGSVPYLAPLPGMQREQGVSVGGVRPVRCRRAAR
ncbi:hypothetical protein GCM10020256_17960 [Streptomyces thermocoprophilus]